MPLNGTSLSEDGVLSHCCVLSIYTGGCGQIKSRFEDIKVRSCEVEVKRYTVPTNTGNRGTNAHREMSQYSAESKFWKYYNQHFAFNAGSGGTNARRFAGSLLRAIQVRLL